MSFENGIPKMIEIGGPSRALPSPRRGRKSLRSMLSLVAAVCLVLLWNYRYLYVTSMHQIDFPNDDVFMLWQDQALESIRVQPKLTNASIAILVLSARSHFDERDAIRNAWARGHDNVYFVVGKPCHVPDHRRKSMLECEEELEDYTRNHLDHAHHQLNMQVETRIRKEQDDYKDLIFTDTIESYRGLPLKLLEALTFLVSNTNVKWFVKADDNMVVRVSSLQNFLTKSELRSDRAVVVGEIVDWGSPVWKSGKWADLEYPRKVYPPWPKGSCGYVISRRVAEYVKHNAKNLFISQGEDTSLGIWLDESPLRDQVQWIKSPAFKNEGQCEDPTAYVIGHDLTPERILQCYDQYGDEIENAADQTEKEEDKEEMEMKTPKTPVIPWTPARVNETASSNLVVLIMSARENYKRRQAIRETWASGRDNVYFVVAKRCDIPPNQRQYLTCERGNPSSRRSFFGNRLVREPRRRRRLEEKEKNHDDDSVLAEEQKEYGDMIRINVKESYRALPHKLSGAFGWVINNTKAKWIAKADDDLYVRMDDLQDFVSNYDEKVSTVMGEIIWESAVARTGKWTEFNYRHSHYPPWPRGASGYVVSREIAKYVSDHNKDLFKYQGEDTSLGIWLNESPFKSKIKWVNSKSFSYEGECENPNLYMIGHDLSPARIRNCHAAATAQMETAEEQN